MKTFIRLKVEGISRSYAIATMQCIDLSMDGGSYNAELVKQLTPEMQTKIVNYGTPE